VIVTRLELVDFRNYANAAFDFEPGTTAVVGLNGQGKTNLAEAMAYLATLDSFRGAPLDAMIRVGADAAVVRATVVHDDGREVLVELELSRNGRNRVLINRQKLGRARDLLGVMRVTVFSPDDLSVVKEGPGGRRQFLDDVLVSLALKYDALRLELDRIVKQRNMLLKQAGGRLNDETAPTLDVWDSKMAEVGDQFGHARAVLVARLTPLVGEAYEQLADRPTSVELRYEPTWRQRGLSVALAEARIDARTHSSQGEQRTLALALRLGAHRLVTDRAGSAPVLVLDDVLSELDPGRCEALLRHLPAGQVVLTTAGVLPEAAHPDAIVRIEAGMVMS
jgi:DNA replication and repair protein RecF